MLLSDEIQHILLPIRIERQPLTRTFVFLQPNGEVGWEYSRVRLSVICLPPAIDLRVILLPESQYFRKYRRIRREL